MKLILIAALSMVAMPAFAAKYTIDKAHSSVEFSVNHLGFFPVKGKFKEFDGSIEIDEATGKAKALEVRIDVDSIDTNNGDRDAHLKSKDFFNVRDDEYNLNKRYRYITFKAKNVTADTKKINGKLKILKTRKNVTFNTQVKSMKDGEKVAKIGVVGSSKINRKDFGLTWQKPATGALEKAAGLVVGNEVTMTVNLVAVPVPPKKKKK